MIELLQNKKPDDMFHLERLNVLATWELQELYPNIERSLKIFLTMSTTVATAERNFSELKIIKNYLRSTSGQQRTSSLALFSIERGLISEINFDQIITNFANIKARKVNLLAFDIGHRSVLVKCYLN